MSWQRRTVVTVAVATGFLVASAWLGHPTPSGLAAAASVASGPSPGRNGGEGEGESNALLSLLVAAALLGVAAWAALVLRGLTGSRRRRLGGTHGRHRRERWDEDEEGR